MGGRNRNKKRRTRRQQRKILAEVQHVISQPRALQESQSKPKTEPLSPEVEGAMIEMIIEHRKRLRSIRKIHLMLCLVGFMASLYAVYVERKLEDNPNYKALCDVSETMSCTKVFASQWGKGFGLIGPVVGANHTLNQPNGVFGVISYPLFILSSRFESMFFARITLMFAISGILMAWYLAYILIYLLNDICLVCYTIYLVNFLLVITSVIIFRNALSLNQMLNMRPTSPPKQEKKRV